MVRRPKELSIESLYPTERARKVADEAFDKLPLSTSLGEACRVWELAYLEANGKVRPPKGMRG